MTLILPIALVGGGAILALALYGFYQRSLSQMWERHYGDAYSDNLKLTDARNQAQADLTLAKDEIATLEAERDALKKAMQQMHGRYEKTVIGHAEDMNRLNAGYEGVVAGLKSRIAELEGDAPRVISAPTNIITLDSTAPAPVVAGSDGEPVYYVTPKAERKPTPRKRGNGKATGEAGKE